VSAPRKPGTCGFRAAEHFLRKPLCSGQRYINEAAYTALAYREENIVRRNRGCGGFCGGGGGGGGDGNGAQMLR